MLVRKGFPAGLFTTDSMCNTCTCRCLAQLGALGYVLVPALALNSWWLLLIYALALTAVASAEAVSRSTHGYQVSHGPAYLS